MKREKSHRKLCWDKRQGRADREIPKTGQIRQSNGHKDKGNEIIAGQGESAREIPKKTGGYPWISVPLSDDCYFQKHILFIHCFTSSLPSFFPLLAYDLPFFSGLLPGSGTVACVFLTCLFVAFVSALFFLHLYLALSIPVFAPSSAFFSASSLSHILQPINIISGVMSLLGHISNYPAYGRQNIHTVNGAG